MSNIIVRPAAANDYAAWLSLRQRHQTFYKVDLPVATKQITRARLLDPAEPMHLALAEIQRSIMQALRLGAGTFILFLEMVTCPFCRAASGFATRTHSQQTESAEQQ